MTDKPHAVAVIVAREISYYDRHPSVEELAEGITAAYQPLVEAAREMLGQFGFSGPGQYSQERYYCQFCGADNEDWAEIEHTETCRMQSWRATLQKVLGDG